MPHPGRNSILVLTVNRYQTLLYLQLFCSCLECSLGGVLCVGLGAGGVHHDSCLLPQERDKEVPQKEGYKEGGCGDGYPWPGEDHDEVCKPPAYPGNAEEDGKLTFPA